MLDAPLPHARQEHAAHPKLGAEMPEHLETEGLEQRRQQARAAKLMRTEGAALRR